MCACCRVALYLTSLQWPTPYIPISHYLNYGCHLSYMKTRGPGWRCNAHLSIIALSEPDLELIKANIMIKIQNDYINKTKTM